MLINLLNENFYENLRNISKPSIFVTFSIVLGSFIILRKLFKRKSAVNPNGKAVLITGCDSGFGNQLALSLNTLGFRVYATVLSISSIEELIQKSKYKDQMVVWKMDVTVDEDVKDIYFKLKQDLQTKDNILWAVVSNAGYGILAQLEWVDLDEYKQMFEVNVFGMVRVTKALLPLIRESRGLETLNGYGTYSMTKYAIHSFTRTLRREVNKFGIKVVVIYPGGYKNTTFIETQFKSCDRIWNQLEDSLKTSYGNKQYLQLLKRRQQFSFDYLMSNKSELVINDTVDAVINSKPKNMYKPIGWRLGQFLAFILPIVPSSLVDILDSY